MEKNLNPNSAVNDEFMPWPEKHFSIREAKATDAAAMAKINAATWRKSYKDFLPRQLIEGITPSQKQAEIEDFFAAGEDSQAIALVAEHKSGEIIAFIMAGKNRRQDLAYRGEIYNLHVAPAYQHQGIGGFLVYRVSEFFKQRNWNTMLVWVLEQNPSCRFYEKLGGCVIAHDTDEYLGFVAPVIAYGWQELPIEKAPSDREEHGS